MKKYQQLSPERAKVWTEKSPKYHYNHQHNNLQQQQHKHKVPVVYYLCRNRQLEHPHFMEVPLSTPDGLYLRDVVERLNGLRGRGMASMYAWSCKRSYKNGFVWHDLCEEDLILPAHRNEYVLKGSELFEESNSGRFSPAGNLMSQNQRALPEPPSFRSQEESSSSSSLNGRTIKSSQDDELSPPAQRLCTSAVSPDSNIGKNSPWNGSLSLIEYKVNKKDGVADASTQTEDKGKTRRNCARGVSTDDGLLDPECSTCQNEGLKIKETSEICNLISPPPSTSSTSSSGRTDTLEALIRSDARKLNSFRILEEDEFRMPSGTKLKPSNIIMQLISCGSVSVKDPSFGMIPTYKPRFSHSKVPSPLFSTSLMFGELDCLSENPRPTGVRAEDKEYFSGSFVETNMVKEGIPTLKRSSSYNADRSTQQLGSVENNEAENSTRVKCIPRSLKASITKQPRCESMRSPLSDGRRISSERVESSRTLTPGTPSGGSKRITEPSSGKTQPRNLDSCGNEKENKKKVELAPGARVVIQSKACDSKRNSLMTIGIFEDLGVNYVKAILSNDFFFNLWLHSDFVNY
ncbi:protein SOSEKI 3-like isoform X2 [Primulina huaijiensis]|uniref:protein SOSEKI 3-like isoform X2 n=1 Tax=Primulina huaijiensis TaxID=1492673 RepID=UPI003CC77248